MENLLEVWNKSKDKERAEFIAGICLTHHALICRVISEQGHCNVAWLKELLFNKGKK